jgi:hypothetical protein
MPISAYATLSRAPNYAEQCHNGAGLVVLA